MLSKTIFLNHSITGGTTLDSSVITLNQFPYTWKPIVQWAHNNTSGLGGVIIYGRMTEVHPWIELATFSSDGSDVFRLNKFTQIKVTLDATGVNSKSTMTSTVILGA